MTEIDKYRAAHIKYAWGPIKLGISGFIIFYLLSIPLDVFFFPLSHHISIPIRLGIVLLNIGMSYLLTRKSGIQRHLNQCLILIFSTSLIGIWITLMISQGSEPGRPFYLYVVPMMMVSLASFYDRGIVSVAITYIGGVLGSSWLVLQYLKLPMGSVIMHILLFSIGVVVSLLYTYWIQKVRLTIYGINSQLEEQKENLRIRLQQVGERNRLLTTQKELLATKLDYFSEQLPKSLEKEIMGLFRQKGLIPEEIKWEEQVFSNWQLQTLTEQYQLKKDQILLLSGVYLGLSYDEIRESLFPHLSIRSVENMASSLRKALNLPRGADLSEFMDAIGSRPIL